MGKAEFEREVAGEYNTFLVYLLMLKVRRGSAREVAQGLGFSSPSLAIHHLSKLDELGLVEKDSYGVYHVVPRKFGLLRFLFVVGRFFVPRSFFYMVLYGVAGVCSLFLLSGMVLYVTLLFSLLGFVIHFVETMEFYRVIPKTGAVQEVEQGVQKND